jgi:hypothetical protein
MAVLPGAVHTAVHSGVAPSPQGCCSIPTSAEEPEELRPQDELASAVSDKKNNDQNHEYHE